MLKETSYFCKIDGSMQKAMIHIPEDCGEPRPLVVALHTWSAHYTQPCSGYYSYCEQNKWNMIFPDFRGPNWFQDGCGSDLAISDIEDAVKFMKDTANVDPSRIYLAGGSGGGHFALLLAGRRPDLWTAVSAWCPISDIAAWHQQCKERNLDYYKHIESSCGGDPETNPAAKREARLRSPLAWLPNAVSLPVAINTGIHDGHTGSVPVSQALNAFNILAYEKDRISEADIEYMVKEEKIPAHLLWDGEDPSYGERKVYIRRQSQNVRLSIFEGGHNIMAFSALEWLGRQKRGEQPDWSPSKVAYNINEQLGK